MHVLGYGWCVWLRPQRASFASCAAKASGQDLSVHQVWLYPWRKDRWASCCFREVWICSPSLWKESGEIGCWCDWFVLSASCGQRHVSMDKRSTVCFYSTNASSSSGRLKRQSRPWPNSSRKAKFATWAFQSAAQALCDALMQCIRLQLFKWSTLLGHWISRRMDSWKLLASWVYRSFASKYLPLCHQL